MSKKSQAIETIEYPVQTSQWGKTLIDNLNSIFERFEKHNDAVLNKITEQYEALKSDVIVRFEKAETTANEALLLAKENKKTFETFKTETEEKFNCVNAENKMLKYNNDRLICENKQMRQQTNNNENYSRRKNIVIRGIAEEEDETNATCEEKVRRFMCEKLKLTEDTVSAMDIVRCHRMGVLDAKRRGTRHAQKRPMIVRFNSYRDKTTVWEKRFELTGNECSMSENYSRDTEFNRQKLYAIFKKAKNMDNYKKRVFLNGDILMVDGTRYTVDNMDSVPPELHPRQFSEKRNATHLIFGGIHSVHHPLSNWYPCKFVFEGHTFESSEQAYQWAKAKYCKDDSAAEKLLFTTSPREAKDIGSTVTGLRGSDWEKKKNDVMQQILFTKFRDNQDLKKQLLDTGDIILAEAGRDIHWAAGLTITRDDLFETKKWKGQNWLGKLLSTVRRDLKNL